METLREGRERGGGDASTSDARKANGAPTGAKREEIDRVRKSLPIYRAKDRLMEEIRKSETVIIIGETGSGKTTQIPQYVYEDMTLTNGLMIGVTQPRRVAAVSVSRRVADETGTAHGTLVGYAIRFEDVSSEETRIKFLTDGMLLREAVGDPLLSKYGVIMIDEAHERTLQTDFLLGTIKGVQRRRRESLGEDQYGRALPPLRVIVMSATLEASSFSKFFDDAPVIYSRGRTFPVEMFYTEEPEEDYLDAAMWTVLQVNEEEAAGDVLVFLTGQEEIESLGRMLREKASELPSNVLKLNVVLLFAALPPEEQMKVFEPTPLGTRKVVLATNIAETSLTINGIRYVVDSGLSKLRTHHPRSGVDELLVTPIAQSQAQQRAGRAGREAPGKCFRLYTEEIMPSLEKYVKPELLRTNLSGVVLQLKAMQVDDILSFPFIDPPPKEALLRSLELLYSLDALDDDGKLNDVGKKMARFPLEPMAARCVIAAEIEGCAIETLAVLSMLSTDSVFQFSREADGQKNVARHKLKRKEGDHLTLLRVFNEFSACSPKRSRDWCREHQINHRAMTKAVKINEQLTRAAMSQGINLTSCEDDFTLVLRSLVSGFFMNTASKEMDGSFKVFTTGQKLTIHPSSVMFQSPPETILFNELVRTNKMYARDVSSIKKSWLSELASKTFSRRSTN